MITRETYFAHTERLADMIAWCNSNTWLYTKPELLTLSLRSDDLLYMVDDGWTLDDVISRLDKKYEAQCNFVLAANHQEQAA